MGHKGCHSSTLQDRVHIPSLTIRYFSCPLTRTVLMVCKGGFSGRSLASCENSRKRFLICWPQSSLVVLLLPTRVPGRGWGLHNSHPKAVAKEGLQEG